MEITFLGGADGIGASCAVVTIGSTRIAVDCGIRMSGEDRLPDLGLLTSPEYRDIQALVITHAHTDHTGALPVFHQHFPAVPIYMTAPTRALVEVLLRDSLRIMQMNSESEGEIPLYSPPLVDAALERIVPVAMGTPVEIGGAAVTWFPAGHILGAASVGIEAGEGGKTERVLFSGDISAEGQITVPGMLAPRAFRPDVLVMESTYGNRLHSPRELEERRLLEMVSGVIERGGKLLIPAFAVGRAQELALILLREFRRNRVDRFPVYLDGMVRSVCGVYSSFAAHQGPYPRKLAERFGNPFLNVVDEIQAVGKPDDRERILAGPPCAVIASSGMLSGGASVFYAGRLAAEPRNGIAITGYQDEESPGRRLLDLAERTDRDLVLDGRTVPVRCSFSKYSLSAHADANEIAGLIERIRPREVVLVHGDGQARPALAELLWRRSSGNCVLHLPRTGETFRTGHSKGIVRRRAPAGSGIGNEGPLDGQSLAAMAARLRERGDDRKAVSAIDLLQLWFGPAGWDEDAYATLSDLLAHSEYFQRHPQRPHFYRVTRSDALFRDRAGAPETMDPNALAARVDATLGPETGLYRKGWDQDRHVLRLYFEFPDVALSQYRDRIDKVVEGTGWTVAVNDRPHQGRLVEEAVAVLPAASPPIKTPSVRLEKREVRVLPAAGLDEAAAASAAERFRRRTGFKLVFDGVPAAKAAAFVRNRFEPEGASPEVPREPLRFEMAVQLIEAAFEKAPAGERPIRFKRVTDAGVKAIEMKFVSGALARRHGDLLHSLARDTGWRLRIHRGVQQQILADIAREVLPPEIGLLRAPSLHNERETATLKLDRDLDGGAAEAAREAFRERTGWDLDLETPVGPVGRAAGAAMEINAAYQALQNIFAEAPDIWRPYKMSRKSEGGAVFIELSFITPEVAGLQRDRVEQASKRVGYELRIRPEANQVALLGLVARIVPHPWGLRKQAFHKVEKTVRIRCFSPPAPGSDAFKAVQTSFREATGYGLELG